MEGLLVSHRHTQNVVVLGNQWETLPPCRRVSDALDFLSKLSRDSGLPSQGVYGEVDEEYRSPCTLPALEIVRHDDYCGRGIALPPMVSPLRHAGSVGGLKQPTPQHHTIQKGGGMEAAQTYHK